MRALTRTRGATLAALAVATILLTACVTACGPTIVLNGSKATKDVAETVLYDARVAQNNGIITEKQFEEIRAAYDELKEAQDMVIDLRLAYLKNPTDYGQNAIDAQILAVSTFSLKFIDICRKYGFGEGVLWSSQSNKQ